MNVLNSLTSHRLVRPIAFFLKLLAWLALLVGIIAAIVILAARIPGTLKLIGLVTAWLVCIGWFVQLYLSGSVLSLLMDIENNIHLLAAPPSSPPPASSA